MAKQRRHPEIAVSLIVMTALLGCSTWWLKEKIFSGNHLNVLEIEQVSPHDQATAQNVQQPQLISTAEADGRLGRSLLPGQLSTAKQTGLEAFAAGDYATAQQSFSTALQQQRNDPEALIYLNNAKVGDSPAYVIAASMPIGEVLAPSLEIMRGVAQAQTEVNAKGGINGIPLKVLLFDDQGDSRMAKAIAAQLVEDKEVLGVVGHYASDTSLAAAEVYEPGQLTMVSPISTAVKFADAGDYIFRTVPSDLLAAKTLALHTLIDSHKAKVAVFYTSQSTYSQSIQSEFTTTFLNHGGQLSAAFDVSEPGFDATKAILTAKEKGADVIMLALTIDTSDISLKIIAANRRSLPLLGGDDLYDSKILKEGQKNVLGLTVAVPWHIHNHLKSSFVMDSRQLWGGDVNWRTVTAYDATMALAEGIKQDPTRTGVASTLGQLGFRAQGATHQVVFFPTGDRNQPSQLVKVVPGPRSGSGYDYVPVN